MQKLLDSQRHFFHTQVTRPLSFRIAALKRLRAALHSWEARLSAALHADLGKSAAESYMCEIGMCLSSISDSLAHLKKWAAPKRVHTPLSQFPGYSRIIPEPYGVALIMSPWNYPVLLSLDPLIAAISAGNCCVLRPSGSTPHVAQTLHDMIADTFPREHVTVALGGRDVADRLLELDFDYLFFTGSPGVGKKVMKAAAEHLTPVTLELGGKSPCIVHADADIPLAARRIAFGKTLNAGQTCVAPDYALVHSSVREQFAAEFARAVREMLGDEPQSNPSFTHIISRAHYDRLMSLMQGVRIRCGGVGNPDTLRIQPTLLDDVTPESPCMQEEIFGPLLPIISYEQLEEAERFVLARPKPLACYLFTSGSSVKKRLLSSLSSGGVCVNDTIMHLAVHGLPFGGVGQSGMGSYHGKAGFDTFSHAKPVLYRATWLDFPFRYHPLSAWKENILRIFLR